MHSGEPLVPLRRYTLPFYILLVAWSGVIVLIGTLHYQQSVKGATELARTEARSSYERDLAYRHWAARAGGVYLPSDYMAPNPYLAHLPERDITTPAGQTLTLVNPAYMTRTVYEQSARKNHFYGRITGLEPINPDNAPDHWERAALQALQSSQTEVSELIEHQGKRQLRYMGPLRAEPGCLGCHNPNRYEVGDLIGGISVSARWSPYQKELTQQLQLLGGGYGVLWVLGVLGLLDMRRRVVQSLSGEREAREQLAQRERTLISQSQVAALGEMTSAIAHHWRQPLTVISLMVQEANEAWRSGDLDERYMARTTQKVKELTTELSETLTLLGGIHTRREDLLFCSAADQLEAVIELMRPELASEQIALSLKRPPLPSCEEGGELFLYPSALRHGVINLITNARDAILMQRKAQQGAPLKGEIRIEVTVEEGSETVRICDNGGGFSPEALMRAFEPFYSTKASTKGGDHISGTGLGLYVTKLIIEEQMGGAIALENCDQGACVLLTLPRKRAF